MKPSLNPRLVTGGFGLALILFLGVGATSFLSIQRLIQNKYWVEHTYQVLRAIDKTHNSLQAASLGRRGYSLTQDPAFLTDY